MEGLRVDISRRLDNFELNLNVEMQGKTLGILGASGCGKSMTLKMIAGIIRPDGGKILYQGKPFYDSEKKIDLPVQKRKVGYLFQNYALFPNMTVYQNIAAGYQGNKTSRVQATEELIRKFRLSDLKDQYPAHLSGGQQQRTALARIVNSNPEILLLDEPFSAMDSFLKEELQVELRDFLKEFGHLTVIVSHSRDEIYKLCDQTMVMENGKSIVLKDTKQLFEQPEYVQAARLTGCKNLSRARKAGDYLVEAVDFGIRLQTAVKVADDIRYVGIRAHDFIPAGEHEAENQAFPITVCEVTEAPFEWIILFKCSKEDRSPMWMKIPKNIGDTMRQEQVPKYMKVPPEKILLLR